MTESFRKIMSDFLRGRGRYWVSVFFFFLTIGILIFGFVYSTSQVNYIWRWNRIPQYFYFKETVEIDSEIEGEVTGIETVEDEVSVTITNPQETDSYLVPLTALKVNQGDYLYPGDMIGSFERSRPGLLLQGLWTTFKVSIVGIILGIFIGLVTGLARISREPALKWLAITYIELIRGSPLLVQIFIWYFVLGTVINQMLAQRGVSQLPPIWYGVAALATFAGAYIAEIVRAGIQSIHRGQMEAARSLGMSYIQSMRHIILPQAFRRIIPPLAGQFISLVKDSSLLGIIAIRELLKATREIITVSLQPYELFFVCALLYLAITFSLSMLTQYLEKRLIYDRRS